MVDEDELLLRTTATNDNSGADSSATAEGGQSLPRAAVTTADNNNATTTGHSSSSAKVKTEPAAAPAETVAIAINGGSCGTRLHQQSGSNSATTASNSSVAMSQPGATADSAIDSGGDDSSNANPVPLNLTVKKRRTGPTDAATAPRRSAQQERSAFETVTRSPAAAAAFGSALSMALSSSAPSPYVLNRILPFSLLSNNSNSTSSSSGGGSTAANSSSNGISSESFLNGQESLLLSTYFGMTPTGKQQRPFKAYNPMDPMSALQISSLNLPLRSGGPAAAAPAGGNASNGSTKMTTAQYLTDQLLQPYRQYLQQAPGLLSPMSRGTGANVGSAGRAAKVNNDHKSLLGGRIANGAGQNTPSPPEVTSTSHPHTDHNQHHHHHQHLLTGGRCLSSPSPSGSDTGASSAGLNSSSSPVTSDELLERIRDGQSSSCANSGASKVNSGSVAGSPGLGDGQQQQQQHQQQQQQQQQMTSAARRKSRILPDTLKDEAYWERRRKNNEAAKRSRDARRAKEDEIAVRAALLEQENMRLRIEVAALKAETEKLRQMLLKG